jgi:hypothetical protein
MKRTKKKKRKRSGPAKWASPTISAQNGRTTPAHSAGEAARSAEPPLPPHADGWDRLARGPRLLPPRVRSGLHAAAPDLDRRGSISAVRGRLDVRAPAYINPRDPAFFSPNPPPLLRRQPPPISRRRSRGRRRLQPSLPATLARHCPCRRHQSPRCAPPHPVPAFAAASPRRNHRPRHLPSCRAADDDDGQVSPPLSFLFIFFSLFLSAVRSRSRGAG